MTRDKGSGGEPLLPGVGQEGGGDEPVLPGVGQERRC